MTSTMKKVILIAPGESDSVNGFATHMPVSMIPLVDRPFIQHCIEFLVAAGYSDISLLLCHMPHHIESFLGDGTRWGAHFTYHLFKQPDHPCKTLASLEYDPETPVLLAHAHSLPLFTEENIEQCNQAKGPVRFMSGNQLAATGWTGWACVPPEFLAQLSENDSYDTLGKRLDEYSPHVTDIHVDSCVSYDSYDDIIDAQELVMKGMTPLLITGTEPEPGVHLSRNVALHPTTKITPPVFIGENCRIGPRSSLGPNAVISSNTVIEEKCTIKESLIMSGSYIGEALDISRSLINKNRLVNITIGTTFSISDNFILGSMTEKHFVNSLLKLVSQLIATVLLILLSPLLLVVYIITRIRRSGHAMHSRYCVRLPALPEKAEWRVFLLYSLRAPDAPAPQRCVYIRHFLYDLLPALVSIAKGNLSFVGVAPRSPDDLDALPPDWRALYINSNAGIISESFVLYGYTPTEDELYASEAFYAVKERWLHDLKILCAYILRIIMCR